MERKHQINMWYVVAALIGVMFLQQIWMSFTAVQRISYDQFQTYLKDGQLKSVSVGQNSIEGQFKQPQNGRQYFVTYRVDKDIADELSKYGVTYNGEPQSHLLNAILSWVVPMLIFFGLWMFFIRRIAERQGGLGGFMSIGKSRAKVYVETDTKVTFEDVAGVDEAKEELGEVVDFLRQPEAHGRLGARVPKGVLLVGPPGTGKTLLARAVAGQAGVPFFSINGSEFVEMFVGVGAARVRDLFEQARAKAPCIIFIDELDALGRARSLSGMTGGHDEKEQTLNQLLAEIDGFDPQTGVVLLAATNRPEILDPALLRPGRFDRQILVDRPDRVGRVAILNVHLKKVRLAEDVDANSVAAMTPGFTGADLANLVNEAALLATRRAADAVYAQDFTAAVERIVAGLERKNRLLNPEERRIVAHHEIGHALVALALPGTDPVHKISIIPRGVGALGYTMQRPTEDRYLLRRAELENRLAVLLGGRAAEMLIFGEASTGASDDLSRATQIARDMVTRYGMDPELGLMTYESDPAPFLQAPAGMVNREQRFSEQTGREIDCAVRAIVEAAFQRATEVLQRHRSELETTAQRLLEQETITEAELPRLETESDAQAPSAKERTTP
ncbi:MAG: ATP-dependent zinc metalloprotease FtsH [Ectothiorhodospiraceae bacterium]